MSSYPTLEQVKIASPCPMKWEEMQGNERKRFCHSCQLNVYNISEMAKEEAENLIRDSEDRLCITMFQREDGTILTKDCPVGLKSIRRKYREAILFLSSIAISVLAGIGVYKFFKKNPDLLPNHPQPNNTNSPPIMKMGKVCFSPPVTKTPITTPKATSSSSSPVSQPKNSK